MRKLKPLFFVVWLFSILAVVSFNFLKLNPVSTQDQLLELHSICEIQHLFFGIGISSFLLTFGFSRTQTVLGVFLGAFLWEVCENLWRVQPPIDTVADIILAIVGHFALVGLLGAKS